MKRIKVTFKKSGGLSFTILPNNGANALELALLSKGIGRSAVVRVEKIP
jgi:hypothetical protein